MDIKTITDNPEKTYLYEGQDGCEYAVYWYIQQRGVAVDVWSYEDEANTVTKERTFHVSQRKEAREFILELALRVHQATQDFEAEGLGHAPAELW